MLVVVRRLLIIMVIRLVSLLLLGNREMRGCFKGRRVKSLILRREEPVEKSNPERGFLIE